MRNVLERNPHDCQQERAKNCDTEQPLQTHSHAPQIDQQATLKRVYANPTSEQLRATMLRFAPHGERDRRAWLRPADMVAKLAFNLPNIAGLIRSVSRTPGIRSFLRARQFAIEVTTPRSQSFDAALLFSDEFEYV